MTIRKLTAVLAAATLVASGLAAAGTTTASAEPGPRDRPGVRERVARQTLPPGDGFGSLGAGTTGGAAADRSAVVTVSTRDELAAAVAGNEPKIVYVDGAVDANTDASGRPLSCADYARDGYTLERYLAAYDPEVWGREEEPSGPVEDARRASQQAQAARITIRVGSNTTLLGLPGSSITGASLRLDGVSNVIVRGLTLTDAADCFPSWDPTDGDTGNWNSEYDAVSLTGATNVWFDHNDLSDGDNPDSAQPEYFGRPYQVHDGLLDITNASDLVTVSWNRLHDHDKTMLIGSSDSRTTDRGKLRVTIHHNEFRDLGQRVPRVRFGLVDVYDNHYVQTPGSSAGYVYSWGVGVESHLVAERNYLSLPPDIALGSVVGRYNGTRMSEDGNVVNGRRVDLLAAHNAVSDPDIAEVPAPADLPRRTVHPVQAVAALVAAHAGPEGLRHHR
ncbi:pectate lyase [Auraticoccus sp. F435]|uniref:Pectate lyase n=1 Tax=Auraticoccus cholistanensis TaxID=2656650 RepID=A0A6A9UP05_9ACTN|nr:polysaccharide lyase family 1 protein [Auraticoccus cholistanensis]MVA74606.1 pectate lyase [Auraticoccus cholistanensis]